MPGHSGLLGSAKRLLSTLIGVVATRLELLADEWQEERLRWLQMFFFASFAAFCFCMGVMLLAFFLVVLFWDEHRLAVLASLSFVFFVSGGWLVVKLKSKWLLGSKLFSVSLAELTKDRKALGEHDE